MRHSSLSWFRRYSRPRRGLSPRPARAGVHVHGVNGVRHAGWAGVLVLSLVLGAGSGAAAPLPRAAEIVISGTGSKVGTFTLRQATDVDFLDMTLTIDGSYGGVLLWSARGRPYGGAYRIRALEGQPGPERPVVPPSPRFTPGYQDTLPAGTYRVHVFGDGAVEARIPVGNGAGLDVRPDRPGGTAWLHVEQRALSPDTDAEVERATLAHRFRRGTRSWTQVIGHLDADGYAAAPTLRACLTARTRCGGQPNVSGGDVVNGGYSTGFGVFPDRYNPPRQERALVEVTTERTLVATATIAVLQVDLR